MYIYEYKCVYIHKYTCVYNNIHKNKPKTYRDTGGVYFGEVRERKWK